MNYTALDDEALIRLIVRSNQDALDALYDRYSRLVFSLALGVVGDSETAEEITQDVFFRVWEKAVTYRVEQAKVSTWLTSITRYRAIDILRQRGVRTEQHAVGWDELLPADAPASTLTPENAITQSMEQQNLRAAVAGLPADQREALALAYFHGLSHSEIANKLNVPLGTIKTRIRLGMQKLRDVLRDDVTVASHPRE